MEKLIMPFGTHKGKEVKQLPIMYCKWLIQDNILKGKKYLQLKAKIQERIQSNSIFY